ncbi:unnamed protein product [Mytilus coruscus]|uniref:Uncharacterized protein n=1 Tax=Mytilus coruscus TaxID=42192 RepID=A0A6J8DDZ6_MYTCO|nr:unnamed protein product [Mytilus coruscus]
MSVASVCDIITAAGPGHYAPVKYTGSPHRLENLGSSFLLLKEAYLESKLLHESKIPSWYGSLNFFLKNIKGVGSLASASNYSFKCLYKKILYQYYEDQWRLLMHNCADGKLYQVYSKTLNTSVACISGQGCKCKLEDCFYGDPCLCDNFSHKKSEKCHPDFHLDNSGSTTATVIVSKPGPRGGDDDNSVTSTIIGVVVGILLLIIIAIVIVFLYKTKN